MNSYKKTPPMEIVQRFLAMEALRELGPEAIEKYNENLVNRFVETSEDGTENGVVEFDWEYMIFDAPYHQLDMVFKKIEEEEKANTSSIIGLNNKPLKFKKNED